MIELLFVFFFGLCFGSFVTLASYRLPLGEDIIVKPSRCPKCETKLTFFDLWPVLSWMLSGAKCRHCQAPVHVRYPLTELATGALFVLVYSYYGISWPAILLMLMGVALLIMIVADLEHYIIPDEVHYALAPLALAYHFVIGTAWSDVLSGGALGLGIGLTLHYGYRWLRKKDGLGFGDVKFLGVAGLWLGVLSMVPFLFFSGLLGVLFGLTWRALGKGPIFPFGPALAVSLFLCTAFQDIPNLFWNMGKILYNTY